MDHAIAVKRMVNADGITDRVLRVADIDPGNIFWNFSDDFHVHRIHFLAAGGPCAVEVRMLVR